MIISTETHAERYSSNVYLYAAMICLLAIAAITLFSVALLIRRCRHPKLMVHAENPYHESTDDGISTSLFTSTDPWKFPEHKLTIFHDRVLGK